MLKSRICYIILILLYFSTFLFCQSQRDIANTKFDDAFKEIESGTLRLYFFDALTGEATQNANVTLVDNGEFITDNQGKIEFLPLNDNYIQQVIFKKDGYITSDFGVEIMVGTIVFNRFSVSPNMDIQNFRIVLDWDKEPRDLDAHFVKVDEYHISYRDMKVLSDGAGRLDRDDMNGYGPETITVQQIDKGAVYEYYVYDYTNRNKNKSLALANSKASVKIYAEGKLLRIYKIKSNQAGRKWNVFKIVNAEIILEDNIK
jgi:hypothetical protein